MKYFAHYCSAFDDPKHSRLIEEYGMAGYGVYWRLCEILAGMKKASHDTPEYRFDPRSIPQKSPRRPLDVSGIVHLCANLSLIDAKEDGRCFLIKIPKLNNYTDENTKRNERERSPKRPDNVRVEKIRSDQKREEKKDLTAASPASALGAEPLTQEVNVEEDPETRAQTLKNLRAMADQIFKTDKPKAEDRAVEISSSEELDKPGQPKTVDPSLEQELVLTMADVADLGIEPARANQVTTLLAEYHSARISAFQLSYRLGGILTPEEKLEVLKINGVVARRRPE
jgi:hypothetical protein